MKLNRWTWLLMAVLSFLVPYTLINNFSSTRDSYQLILPLDLSLPFIPIFVIFYLLTFIYVILVPYLLIKDKKKFLALSLSFIFTMLIAYIIFLVFPIKMVLKVSTLGSGFLDNLVQITYLMDAPGFNSFPSLHVALSLLTSLIIYTNDKKHWWVWIAFILISLSTLFIKQHYFIDVVAGVLLGAIGFLTYYFLLPSKRKISSAACCNSDKVVVSAGK